jgi:acyl-CoA dehydrogenase
VRFDDLSPNAALFAEARAFGAARIRPLALAEGEGDPGGTTRRFVSLLGDAGYLAYTVPAPHGRHSLRDLATLREAFAYESSLADTALVMQGLGSHALALAGSPAQQDAWLPRVASGGAIAAFAVTEPEAGSDLGAVATRASADGDGVSFRLDGEKVFISNAGIADFYTVLARTSDDGSRGLSMFLVAAGAAGLHVEPLAMLAPHPLGRISFAGVRAALVGTTGAGYKLALATLAAFRPTVGAAACGLGMRALDEALTWTVTRRQFGKALAEFQATQSALAEMSVDLDAARALVLRAVAAAEGGGGAVLAGSTAKLFATEAAQRIVDRAVQLHGGAGVVRGSTVERLYREVRALRIYEGTSEIQKLIIARELLRAREG